MRQVQVKETGRIQVNESYEGETLERKIQRIMATNEPIENTVPMTYTERKDGVQPQYDIRTDRWDIAIGAMDKVSGSYKAKREERIKAREDQAKAGGTEV